MYYEKHIFVCENKRDPSAPRESCGHKNSTAIKNYLKNNVKELCRGRAIRVNQAGCLDRCEEGPTVVCYPEGKWFRISNEAEALTFIEEYLVKGNDVPRLELPGERKTPE